MKKFYYSLSLLAFLTGCAQTYWVHPSKSEAQFNIDKSYCENEASINVRATVAAPVTPIYTPPSQYNTNCSAMGYSVNCTTTAQPNSLGQLQQQHAQNMAQAGANIGDAFARQRYAENCMINLGWSKQKISKSENKKIEELNIGFEKEMSELNADQIEKMCKAQEFQAFFQKSPCDTREINLAHLAINLKADEKDRKDIILFSEYLQSYQKKEIEIVEKYILDPLKTNYINMRRGQNNRGLALALELYEGKITWGEFNKKRLENYDLGMQERRNLLQPR